MGNLLVAGETKKDSCMCNQFLSRVNAMAKPFKLESFLPFRLNLLAQEISQSLSEIYATRFNLDIPQWRILANLASRGEMTAQEIAFITFSHKSTISRAVTELEARKLIERTTSAKDKRAFAMRVTDKGQKLFEQLLPLVLAFEKDVLKRLKSSEQKKLLEGITALERELLPDRRRDT
jgi:DNA-binding MarR family transcriptional regulator